MRSRQQRKKKKTMMTIGNNAAFAACHTKTQKRRLILMGSSGGLDLTTSVGFGPTDLFSSAMSLASNFWPFLLLGLSFVLAPWIYGIIVSAVKKARASKAA